MITPDTWGYQNFNSTRDILYPYILKLTRLLMGDDLFIIYIQLWLRCLATALLGFAVLKRTGTAWMAIAMTGAVMANPFNYQVDAMVMTDSLFCTGITLVLALLLYWDTQFQNQKTDNSQPVKLRTLAVLSTVIAVTIAIRPIAITLIPLLVIFCWLYAPVLKGRWLKAIAVLIIPLLLILGASKAEHIRLHGTDPYLLKHSLLLGKAGIMDVPPLETARYPEIAKDLHGFMKPRLDDLRQEKNWLTYFSKTRDYEVHAQFQYSYALIHEIAAERNIPAHHIMAAMGEDYIKAHPLLYLKDTAIHTIGSWLIFDESRLSVFKNIVLYSIGAIGVLTFLMMLIGFYRLAKHGPARFPTGLHTPWLCAVYLHGYTLFIGLFGVFVPRYTSCVWPVMCVAIGMPILYALQCAWQNKKAKYQWTN